MSDSEDDIETHCTDTYDHVLSVSKEALDKVNYFRILGYKMKCYGFKARLLHCFRSLSI